MLYIHCESWYASRITKFRAIGPIGGYMYSSATVKLLSTAAASSSASTMQLPANIRYQIRAIEVDENMIRTNLKLNTSTGYPYGQDDRFEKKHLEALVEAEKIRIYFNNMNIPVVFTTRNYVGFFLNSLIKILSGTQEKAVKQMKIKRSTTPINPTNFSDHRAHEDILCANSNLYDCTLGESTNFYLLETTVSLMSKKDLYSAIDEILKNYPQYYTLRTKLYDLYMKFEEQVNAHHCNRLLYTAALLDPHLSDVLFLSESFGRKSSYHTSEDEKLKYILLEMNKQTGVIDQNKVPQIRLIKPSLEDEHGIRMFRCYSSEKQKEIYQKAVAEIEGVLGVEIQKYQIIQNEFNEFINEFESEILPIYRQHEQSFDRMGIHGRLHVSRTLIFAEMMARYLIKQGETIDLNLMRRITGLHDSGRERNGFDRWEKESSELLRKYLIRKGMSVDEAAEWAKVIMKNEQNSQSLEAMLFSSADCLDIMRPFCGHGGREGFRKDKLEFLKDAKEPTLEDYLSGPETTENYWFREGLIDEAWCFIKETEAMKETLTSLDNVGYMNRLLDVIKQGGPKKYPILCGLIVPGKTLVNKAGIT